MATTVRCDVCGDERRVLSAAPFRCPCGGTMQQDLLAPMPSGSRPADRLTFGTPARVSSPVAPEETGGRGPGVGGIVLGAFLVVGSLLMLIIAAVAAKGEIPEVTESDISLIRTFAVLQLLVGAAMGAGGLLLIATGGRFVWLQYGGLIAFVLLRVADFAVTAGDGKAGAASCGSVFMLGIAVWLIVLTERQRQAAARQA